MHRAAALIIGGSAVAVLAYILVVGAQVAPAAAEERPVRIVVVDLDQVVSQCAAGKALQARLQTFQKEVQAEGDKRSQAARVLRARMAEGANSLSQEKLQEMQKQYEDATIALRRFQDNKQREGRKMQTEGIRKIEKLLEPVFTKLRDEHGYDLILNNVPGVVVMAGERVDITSLVIQTADSGE